ncbi:MAG: TonB-dependent receptor [Nitrospirae bacterium]|nr:MAG: TonB-dependent receptor [Nitrospirota bacterium]
MTTQSQGRLTLLSKSFSQVTSVTAVLTGCLVRVVSVWLLALATTIVCTSGFSHAAAATSELTELSLEDLMNIEVTSVSKKPERLSDAAAAVYVITREDIRRSGYTSIPEILRLAPNLQVARVDSSQYAITARGFNSTTANKLLVLIDGRSVYTPLFSGVFWDVQDTMIEDIERIEVISGPGGTLWGSNAVNGVINIITRHSQDTAGALVSLGEGTEERGAGVRYGAKLGEDAALHVYGKGFNRDNTVQGNGTGVQDAWKKGQVGFRTDWGRGSDALTLQGDGYTGTIAQVGDNKSISGANLLARWNRTLQDGSALQVLGYFDRTRRVYPGTFGELLDTYDIEAQHRFQLGASHEIVWGGGYRLMHDAVTNSAVLAFLPNVRVLSLANGFLQDSIALRERLNMTLGVKLESNSYTGLEVQPNARLAWKFRDDALLWSAISRVVRTPSRLDRELFAPGSPPFFLLNGGPDFKSEKLIAYEVGYRAQPAPQASFSISTFYNVYDDLRSIEPGPGGAPVLTNKMEGYTYGVETWGSYRVLDWWRLSAGYNYLKEKLGFKADSLDSNIAAAGNDPAHQFSARSAMNLPHNLEFDAALRVIGALPSPNVSSYVTLDTRLGWTISKGVELSLIGFNLLDHDHPEFGAAPTRSELARAFYARIVWSY